MSGKKRKKDGKHVVGESTTLSPELASVVRNAIISYLASPPGQLAITAGMESAVTKWFETQKALKGSGTKPPSPRGLNTVTGEDRS